MLAGGDQGGFGGFDGDFDFAEKWKSKVSVAAKTAL